MKFLRPGIIIIFVILNGAIAKAVYVLDANCKSAYAAAWSLNSAESERFLLKESKEFPSNSLPLYIENINQFMAVFSSEEKTAYQKYINDANARIDAINNDKKTQWFLFCKSEIYVQTAVLKLKFSDYPGAAYDFNKAYHNLSVCNEQYPGFLPAQKDLLLMKAMVGAVPEHYRWMLKILGFSGDLHHSVSQFESMISGMEKSHDYHMFTKESRIIYAYLNFFMMNNPSEAWAQIDMVSKDYISNPVDAFVRANIAIRTKKNDIAIDALSTYIKTPPPIPYLDYMLGIAKLQRGDKNAGFFLGRYLKEYKGDHYVKDAWLKLGWAFYLIGDTRHYEAAMQLVNDNGTTQLEEDKNALREANASKNLVPGILRARLYFDGGYLDKAKNEIQKISTATLSNDRQKAEYYYRYARILDAGGDDNKALNYYQVVMDKYSNINDGNPPQRLYFAPASALYAGMIWEKNKNSIKAKSFYMNCLSYKDYIYKDSFDQKAYAGLKRVE